CRGSRCVGSPGGGSMRTDSPSSLASAAARLWSPLSRAGRRFASQPRALRWSLVLAAVVAVVAVVYAASGTTSSAGSFVRSGERFGSDDLTTIRHALDAKHLPYRVDSRNRVEVAADRL